MDDKEILKEFPSSIVLTIIGVTFFFAMAHANGTIDVIVRSCVRAVGGRISLIPWVFFVIASILTALGTFSPAAVALLAPAAMLFAAESGISGVVMGALIINGAHTGGFSPISVAGVLVREISEKNHFAITPIPLFISSYAINLIVSIITVVVMAMLGRLHTRTADGTVTTAEFRQAEPITRTQWVTLALIVAILVAALILKLPIGFVGLTAGLILAFFSLDQHKTFVSGISWSTVLLVAGIITYVTILQDAGVIDGLAEHAVKIGVPLVVALVLCYVIGVSSAFASSTALLTAFIPLAAPLLAKSDLSAAGVVAALAISATIVDVSPFSTDGALVVANAQGRDKDRIYSQLLAYAGLIVVGAPALTWALLVPTGIL